MGIFYRLIAIWKIQKFEENPIMHPQSALTLALCLISMLAFPRIMYPITGSINASLASVIILNILSIVYFLSEKSYIIGPRNNFITRHVNGKRGDQIMDNSNTIICTITILETALLLFTITFSWIIHFGVTL